MSIPSKINWISSDGGPYILTSVSSATNWLGNYGNCTSAKNGAETDYDKACQISDHVGILSRNAHDALVISEPDQLTWFGDGGNGGMIVKWIGAESDDQVMASLATIDLNEFVLSKTEFEIKESSLYLFDAADEFNPAASNFLRVNLAPGIYSILTKNYEPSSDLWLFLIRLTKKP